MNEGDGHLPAALPASEISADADGTEEFLTSLEMENALQSSRSLSIRNDDSLARDSVRFDALVDLLSTDGPSSRDQHTGEDAAEVIHPSSPLTSSGLPPRARRSDPFQTPERRPNVSTESWRMLH